ncbi:hypothetical protein C8Q77DRAFT_1159527 [Trametes polyzona]|nr:hypothetical protein C8Q77DRAFT_1159527 [Trametes polyzona]
MGSETGSDTNVHLQDSDFEFTQHEVRQLSPYWACGSQDPWGDGSQDPAKWLPASVQPPLSPELPAPSMHPRTPRRSASVSPTPKRGTSPPSPIAACRQDTSAEPVRGLDSPESGVPICVEHKPRARHTRRAALVSTTRTSSLFASGGWLDSQTPDSQVVDDLGTSVLVDHEAMPWSANDEALLMARMELDAARKDLDDSLDKWAWA